MAQRGLLRTSPHGPRMWDEIFWFYFFWGVCVIWWPLNHPPSWTWPWTCPSTCWLCPSLTLHYSMNRWSCLLQARSLVHLDYNGSEAVANSIFFTLTGRGFSHCRLKLAETRSRTSYMQGKLSTAKNELQPLTSPEHILLFSWNDNLVMIEVISVAWASSTQYQGQEKKTAFQKIAQRCHLAVTLRNFPMWNISFFRVLALSVVANISLFLVSQFATFPQAWLFAQQYSKEKKE